MITKTASEFSKLYKYNGHSHDEKQSKRREVMLLKHRDDRSKCIDQTRSFELIVQSLEVSKHREPRIFKNYIQLSEWMRDKPDDFDNWIMVPCPKGLRCIVIATKGHTKAYNKRGKFISSFRSALPGDAKLKHFTTILDCIYCKYDKSYYVLDVLAFSNQDMGNCEANFRFFWIRNKIDEECLSHITYQNEHAFYPVSYIDCNDPISISDCLSRYPMWFGNQPELDGLLFYHKESSYVHGTTPLVGWLFPFMIPEMFGNLIQINQMYLLEKPPNYVNVMLYIEEFDRRMKQKRKNHRFKITEIEMDETVTSDDTRKDQICEAEKMLELAGYCQDDVHYDDNR